MRTKRDTECLAVAIALAVLIVPIKAGAQSAGDDALLRELASTDANVRRAALDRREDWKPGPVRAIPLLVRLTVHDPEYSIRLSASTRLRDMGEPARAAVPDLVIGLGSRSPRERANAVQALGMLGPLAADAVDAIGAMYADTSRAVRFVTGEALFSIHQATPRSIRALVQELHAAPEPAALNASVALGVLGEVAVQPIRPCLDDPKPLVRLYAVYALQGIGAPALEALKDALKDSNGTVRAAAATGLALISPRTRPVRQAMESAAEDRDPQVRALARALLTQPPPTHRPATGKLPGH
jgi:HEAT repeat protein